MQPLLLATRNANKTREFRELLGEDFDVHDLSFFDEMAIPKENGRTFEENAMLKAVAASQDRRVQDRHLLVVADDSGLEVDALGGAPGILSARYAGETASDKENIDKLLSELARRNAPLDQRSARFRCVIALARESEILGKFEGVVEGLIVDLPRGSLGFGYDPIFVPNGFDKTFGELPIELKNRISHRARAIRAFRAELPATQRSD
ncbi:MAG TPA: RdgB/HAM1 family non-canonical purine NTP pyrophosphatase [Chthoniobacterales bacterium]|nr:RdgB/HAM1 family non-canonical purine NTP pyrophosphatase [Chthoniobacterales bacterium]